MNTTTILENHLKLSEQAHSLLLEENSILTEQKTVPGNEFLDRKHALLQELAQSLDAVKQIRESRNNFSESEKELVRAAQNRTMQGLYLDRENEQLLLKHSVDTQVPDTRRAVTPEHLKAAYGQ